MRETESEPDVAVKKASQLGEGSIWDAEKKVLYWVDILAGEVCIFNPRLNENRVIHTCQAVGTVVPRASGGLLVALHNGIAAVDLDTGNLSPIADPERDTPRNRFNDGKCDPAGRFWAGTMEFNGAANEGALYCLDVDHTLTRKVSPVSISNGIVWSLNHETMYFIDTVLNNVRAWDHDIDTGRITRERVVIENAGSGHFDGMTIDEEGMLWIAVFGGWSVRRFDPNNGKCFKPSTCPSSR